jgi:hypothetical protein
MLSQNNQRFLWGGTANLKGNMLVFSRLQTILQNSPQYLLIRFRGLLLAYGNPFR